MGVGGPSRFRLLLLGTGTSGGIPLIGCTCDTCRSDDPRDKRLRSGAALLFDDADGRERVILIDCTPDLREQALRHGLMRCDAILITHHHVDHIFGLDEVRRFNAVMNAPIDVLAESRTMANLRRVFQHIFERERNVNPSFVARLIPREIRAGEALELFGLRVTPIRMLHGRLPIVSFRVELAAGGDDSGVLPLAYCTDVSAVPTESWELLDGLRVLVIDGLRHRHHPTHLTISRACEIASRCRAERTYLTHIAHEVRHAPAEAELPEGVWLGYDGLTLGDGESRGARDGDRMVRDADEGGAGCGGC